MNYQKYVQDVFLEHQNCMGVDLQEAQDQLEENSFKRIENWLYKVGYDLKTDYAFEVNPPQQKVFNVHRYIDDSTAVTGTTAKRYKGVR